MNVQSTSSVLPRRIAASAIDLAAVGFLWLLVLYRLAVRFEIAQRTPDGTPIYSDLQRAELASISDGLNFGRIIGDFYYSIHGRALVLSLLALLIFSLIAWVLVPANTGWSLGHRVMGLMVTDTKGNKPPLDSYLRRYLVGLVDLFPYVIPGLLGWIVAARNEHNQRMGDLSANTRVVLATSSPGEIPETTTTLIRPSATTGEVEAVKEAAEPPAPDSPSSMVDVAAALAGHTIDDPPSDYRVLDLEETGDAIPTVERVDRETVESEFVATISVHEETVIAEQTIEAELPETNYAENWHFPEAQDAPVWTPEPTTDNGPAAPEREPVAADAEGSIAVATEDDTPEAHEPRSEGDMSVEPEGATGTAAVGDPVWNEEWAAWLYWDSAGHQWLRHDPELGWQPIGSSQKA
ncbi:MAG: hypothetical protein HKN24_01855 [Acidimicrobiales bacterium]|nr:hypothetical protein [Acidimicrobiales bacterium]